MVDVAGAPGMRRHMGYARSFSWMISSERGGQESQLLDFKTVGAGAALAMEDDMISNVSTSTGPE